jgi:hypothetical protein
MLRICYRSGYQRFQDLQIDVSQAPDVDTYLSSPVLSQLSQQEIATFEVGSDVNNQLTSPHGEPGKSGIAFVTTSVLVMISPKPNDGWPPHPWFLFGNSSHERNQCPRVIPLLVVRDGSNVAFGADFSWFSFWFRHMHLQTVSFSTPSPELTGRAIAMKVSYSRTRLNEFVRLPLLKRDICKVAGISRGRLYYSG